MYAGHFAAGLAIKAREPEAPMWGILVGVGLLDLLFGPFVLAGIERAAIAPDTPPGFVLEHIDWSHSLLMSVVWSLVFGSLFLGKGRRVAAVMAVAAFSHFLLDLPMHPPDLALWPNAETHLGLGLWRRLPQGWWLVELGVILACGGYYAAKARGSDAFGRRPFAAVTVVLLLHIANAPWFAPY